MTNLLSSTYKRNWNVYDVDYDDCCAPGHQNVVGQGSQLFTLEHHPNAKTVEGRRNSSKIFSLGKINCKRNKTFLPYNNESQGNTKHSIIERDSPRILKENSRILFTS